MKKAEVKKGKKKNVLKEYWPLYLMMLPALLYLLINNYIPMAGMENGTELAIGTQFNAKNI